MPIRVYDQILSRLRTVIEIFPWTKLVQGYL